MKVTVTIGLITKTFHIRGELDSAESDSAEYRSIVPKCANCRSLLNPNLPYLQILQRCANCFDPTEDYNDNH